MAESRQLRLGRAAASVEYEERMGMIFLCVGIHEFPMSCVQAQRLAQSLMELSTTQRSSGAVKPVIASVK